MPGCRDDDGLWRSVGACDGELTLAQITDAVSAILEVDYDALLIEVLPLVRECLRYGILETA